MISVTISPREVRDGRTPPGPVPSHLAQEQLQLFHRPELRRSRHQPPRCCCRARLQGSQWARTARLLCRLANPCRSPESSSASGLIEETVRPHQIEPHADFCRTWRGCGIFSPGHFSLADQASWHKSAIGIGLASFNMGDQGWDLSRLGSGGTQGCANVILDKSLMIRSQRTIGYTIAAAIYYNTPCTN